MLNLLSINAITTEISPICLLKSLRRDDSSPVVSAEATGEI